MDLLVKAKASREACKVKPQLNQGVQPSGFRCQSAGKLLHLLPCKESQLFLSGTSVIFHPIQRRLKAISQQGVMDCFHRQSLNLETFFFFINATSHPLKIKTPNCLELEVSRLLLSWLTRFTGCNGMKWRNLIQGQLGHKEAGFSCGTGYSVRSASFPFPFVRFAVFLYFGANFRQVTVLELAEMQ